MATRYLLSDGTSTIKLEYYILDLFKLHMIINPGDIPGNENLGFNFTLTTTKKDEIESEVRYRVEDFIKGIHSRFPNLKIKIKTISLLDERSVSLVVEVNDIISEDYNIQI